MIITIQNSVNRLYSGPHTYSPSLPPAPVVKDTQDTILYVFAVNELREIFNLTLSCDVAGDNMTYAWFRDGKELNTTLYVQDDGSLLVKGITEGEFASRDGVIYYCIASNSYGTVRGDDITVIYACELMDCYSIVICLIL